MLKTIFLIIISFFAVIGVLECILNALESISVAKYNSIDSVELRVALSGRIDDVVFLLNTIMLQGERIYYKSAATRIVVVDNGLDHDTYSAIKEFCSLNDNITMEKCDDI